ncbi:MAG: thioredoxin domain-containing protein, partial [Rhizobiaceae bacterium]|nr:thioredoxin domain-containing protein [Rhizobiaceae bacterium]
MTLPAENLLADQASPYLRQHSGNPVHWRAWNAKSLAEARDTGKPILLSVGYAACHWCHVMAHESFENPEIAALMNRLFVNIKVDREERPDIDQIFMAALSAMGEQGGWPLTMFLTPDARPFWGGTYFPPSPRYGRPSFPQVLEAVAKAWREKGSDISHSADTLVSHVRSRLASSADAVEIDPEGVRHLAENLLPMIDTRLGGLRGAPKFPNAPFMQTLWLAWLRGRDPEPRDAFLTSYRAMLNGGIYDHLGGGLCRYSTDQDWMVPHFEKMLYDNAQLVRHANWAFAHSGDEMFRERIEQTVAWLLREMRSPDRAFTASLDADSEGEEGLFYTWTRPQLAASLGVQKEMFDKYFGLGTAPHWEGHPVIYRRADVLCDESDVGELTAVLARLLEERERRIRPGRDDKVVVDWNGLAVVALCEAGRTLERRDWIEAAGEAYRAIMARRDMQGRLPHAFLGGAAVYPALSSDYAAMIEAAIALSQATQDSGFIDDARRLAALLQEWHGDPDGFMLTASDAT